MYAGTIFNYIDNSRIDTEEDIALNSRSPLWLMASAFDKGPEDLQITDANNFYKLYGDTMNFEKYGQLNLQAKNIIDNGGRLWVKRLVADDATYGNLYYIATVEKADSNKVKITWTAKSEENIKSYSEFYNAIISNNTADTFVPFAFIDNGRGGSVIKSVKFSPDYNLSRNIDTVLYRFDIYEDGKNSEYRTVTVDPNVTIDNQSYKLYKEDYLQIDAYSYESTYDDFIKAILDVLNENLDESSENYITEETLRSYDLLFGYNNRGEELGDNISIVLGENTASLNSQYGVELSNGTDGSFKDITYIQSDGSYKYDDNLVNLMVSFYNGEIDEKIYDVDNYRLFAIADANLPVKVKQAITEYAIFRNDCFVFRDLGIEKDDGYNKILSRKQNIDKTDTDEYKYPLSDYTFSYADYLTTYEIIDPESRKRIKVTMLYDLVSCLTRSYINNPFNPNAGIINGYVLESAIPDTLNYTPLKTPVANYKQAIDDLRINYASYNDTNLVVQSLYTNNKIYSQLSYISNVLAMQEIGRRVAEVCPQIRFSLQLSANDVSNYTKIINAVLENYADSFDTLELVYSADELHINQKIFYASIQFSFANWYQTEIFDLIANPTVIVTNSDLEEE